MNTLNLAPTFSNINEWVRQCALIVNQLGKRLSASAASQMGDVTGFTSSATLGADDYLAAVDATAGPVTITVPLGVNGRQYAVKKIDSSGNAVTVARTGSDTIDGATTYALTTQYQSVTIIGRSGGYWVL